MKGCTNTDQQGNVEGTSHMDHLSWQLSMHHGTVHWHLHIYIQSMTFDEWNVENSSPWLIHATVLNRYHWTQTLVMMHSGGYSYCRTMTKGSNWHSSFVSLPTIPFTYSCPVILPSGHILTVVEILTLIRKFWRRIFDVLSTPNSTLNQHRKCPLGSNFFWCVQLQHPGTLNST